MLLSDQESKPCGLYSYLLNTALQLAAVAVSQTLVVLKHKITKLNLACVRNKLLRLTLKAKAHTGAQGAHFEVKKKQTKPKTKKQVFMLPTPTLGSWRFQILSEGWGEGHLGIGVESWSDGLCL